MGTIYLRDISGPDALSEALRAAGFAVTPDKAPEHPAPGDLALVAARVGVTSTFRHSLNNPLTAVLGFLQLLQRQADLSEAAREKVERVYEHAIRVRDLLRMPGDADA